MLQEQNMYVKWCKGWGMTETTGVSVLFSHMAGLRMACDEGSVLAPMHQAKVFFQFFLTKTF